MDSIDISGINFKIVARYVDNKYNCVELKSKNKENKYYSEYYFSNSENGLPRYQSRIEGKSLWQKGLNYITSSLMHHELLKFVYSNYYDLMERFSYDNEKHNKCKILSGNDNINCYTYSVTGEKKR